LTIKTLSNRPDLISGTETLVGISLPRGVSASAVRVHLNGRDVTSAFAPRSDGGFAGLMGVVGGLREGPNRLTARVAGGRGARLTITDHPIGGPVFAGPQVQPWVCGTQAAGLGPASDAQCNAPTQVSYVYKSTNPGQTSFQPYDAAHPPSDVATATTDQGTTVPYVVRVETGTEDRGIYRLAVLADPARPWQPWAPQHAWNRKIVWVFGGGTAPQYSQGGTSGVLDDGALQRGFMVASSGLNVHGENANDTVSAEAMMMLKEHIADTYGAVRYVIGEGCSGGGLQQYMIGDTYPGLLDGLLPSCSFSDVWSTAPQVFDCSLLNQYFNQTSAPMWAVAQQQALVTGYQDPAGCNTIAAEFASLLKPTVASNCNLPASMVYDPQANPRGARCTVNDYQVAVWGRRTPSGWGPVEKKISSGFANRAVDNVGVQYGLNAVRAGQITPAQFADLNAKIGGYDIDGNWQPGRTLADPGAIATAYRAGQVTNGRHLAQVPIIDLRGHDNEEIHQSLDSHITQARLQAANGTSANMALWTGAVALAGDPTWDFCGFAAGAALGSGGNPPLGDYCVTNSPLLVMDRWLTAIQADHTAAPLARKVIADKPAVAVDSCWASGVQVTDQSACQAAFPYFGDPRMAAGGPLANDVLKCQLKPLQRADYGVTFTDAEWAQLEQAFPTGVCDWRKPGADQQAPVSTWLTFAGGPGGQRLGRQPSSIPLRGTPSRVCVSRRRFIIHVPAPHGQRVLATRISIYRGRHRVRSRRGAGSRALIDLRGLGAGRFTVRIVAHTSTGKTVRSVRSYNTCKAGGKRAGGRRRP
jgi:hypothetical protein